MGAQFVSFGCRAFVLRPEGDLRLREFAGFQEVPLVRAPGGGWKPRAGALGLVDWRLRPPEAARRSVQHAKPQAVRVDVPRLPTYL